MSKLHFTAMIIVLTLTGCISSILKEPMPVFSKEIDFEDPTSPFQKIKFVSYPSWKSSDSQNVILIISNCDEMQSSSNTAHQILSENIDDVKIEPAKIDGLKIKKYVAKSIQGTIDGEAVEIQSLSFQNKNCTYLSALSGKPSSVSKDLVTWKNFLNSVEFRK